MRAAGEARPGALSASKFACSGPKESTTSAAGKRSAAETAESDGPRARVAVCVGALTRAPLASHRSGSVRAFFSSGHRTGLIGIRVGLLISSKKEEQEAEVVRSRCARWERRRPSFGSEPTARAHQTLLNLAKLIVAAARVLASRDSGGVRAGDGPETTRSAKKSRRCSSENVCSGRRARTSSRFVPKNRCAAAESGFEYCTFATQPLSLSLSLSLSLLSLPVRRAPASCPRGPFSGIVHLRVSGEPAALVAARGCSWPRSTILAGLDAVAVGGSCWPDQLIALLFCLIQV